MTVAEKAFWVMAFIVALGVVVIISGCHTTSLPVPKIEIQETTNNLAPIWPK